MSNSENSEFVQQMLQKQLEEVEMLQSMYPNPGEFSFDRPSVLEELQAVQNGTMDSLESSVGFTIKISTSSSPAYELELGCRFPRKYPTVHPDVFLRATDIDRERHRRLTEALNEHLDSLEKGEAVVWSLVLWLQDNGHLYLKKDKVQKSVKSNSHQNKTKEEVKFKRLWIYSHHIYSKVKRQNIIDWAKELDLRGFSLAGKPGVICVEGYSEDVEDFWSRIRNLTWKQIKIKEEEVEELKGRSLNGLCRFSRFQELGLEVVQPGKGHNYHMDQGKFLEFLKAHDSAYIFRLYFGVEGKSVGD